jgi:16S rRNA (cytidine1402-2'-O)-methyltransferase
MPLNSHTGKTDRKDNVGCLYVVATPIGNRDDITLRALAVLREVGLIAAEDTRHTGRLLTHYGIKGKLVSYHEHNETECTPGLIRKIEDGESIALVSNAGTPSVSDPGYILIREAVAKGLKIIPIPGVSAAVTAMSVAGLPTDSFVFIGFPAKKKGRRLKQLDSLISENRTIVFYESPKRILSLLEDILTVMGDRYCVLSREMTKLHEEFIRGPASIIHESLLKRASVKGECTLLVSSAGKLGNISDEDLKAELERVLSESGKSLSDIAKETAKKLGLSKKKVYDEALKIRKG